MSAPSYGGPEPRPTAIPGRFPLPVWNSLAPDLRRLTHDESTADS